VHRLIRQFGGVSAQISLRGSWVDVLYIFVYDLDPSNAGVGLRFMDLGWKPRCLLELGRISIPPISVGLRPQIRRDSIS
jgi:hypothetical protein